MTSEIKTTNQFSFEGMENNAINWFPKPNTSYSVHYTCGKETPKPYIFKRSKSKCGEDENNSPGGVRFYYHDSQFEQHTTIYHKDWFLETRTGKGFEIKCSLDNEQINGVLFSIQAKPDAGRPLKQQVVLARFSRSTQKQHVICSELQNLHAGILNTALPPSLIEKYFTSYKPKTAEMDGMLHFWIRTIVTHRKDTQALVEVCREIVASDGTILGQACYDVENKVIYRYVRDDKTPFRAWQSIGIEEPSSYDPINLKKWPRKERVGLCSEETLCSGATVSDVWNVSESDRLTSWTKVTDASYGYLKYQCLNSHCSPCVAGVGRWMLDTELQCKNILEISPIVDHLLDRCSSINNEKNEKSSVVSCTCTHTVPQLDPKPTPSENSMDVSTNPDIGVAEKNPVADASQPPLVGKTHELAVSSIKFKASVRLQGSNCNPMSSKWSIDCSKTGNNLRGLLYYLKAWSDGSYFHATAAMDGQMEYTFSDMTIIWRNVDEIGNSLSYGCSTETKVILKSGMENNTGIVAIDVVKTRSDIDLFYRRIGYLISELQKLV